MHRRYLYMALSITSALQGMSAERDEENKYVKMARESIRAACETHAESFCKEYPEVIAVTEVTGASLNNGWHYSDDEGMESLKKLCKQVLEHVSMFPHIQESDKKCMQAIIDNVSLYDAIRMYKSEYVNREMEYVTKVCISKVIAISTGLSLEPVPLSEYQFRDTFFHRYKEENVPCIVSYEFYKSPEDRIGFTVEQITALLYSACTHKTGIASMRIQLRDSFVVAYAGYKKPVDLEEAAEAEAAAGWQRMVAEDKRLAQEAQEWREGYLIRSEQRRAYRAQLTAESEASKQKSWCSVQ